MAVDSAMNEVKPEESHTEFLPFSYSVMTFKAFGILKHQSNFEV